MKRNSGFITDDRIVTSTLAAKGIHDLHDVHIKRVAIEWPRTHRFLSLTPSVTTVTEGNAVTFTLVTEHIPNSSTLYYTISTVSGTTMVDADFNSSPNNGGIDGSFSTTNNSTAIVFGLVAEVSPGDSESNVFKLQIRTGSTSGPIVIESSDITVTDAIQIGTDIRSAFYEISNRTIVDSSSGDYTLDYDVGEIQQAFGGSARVYVVLKCTTATTYRNDICIAAVQVLNSSNVIQQTWNFSVNNQSWEDNGTRIAGSSSLLSSYLTPSDVASYSGYAAITAGAGVNEINLASGTGSTYTGMADGIAPTLVAVYSVGNGTVAQSSGANYIYGEVSGASRYSHVVARSPAHTFSAGDKIRVVHGVVTNPTESSTININDSIWIGIY
tara:strand:+ start:590 stop:1741 length:1152 start_codon:yes stop_codon:yes gene_type:complete